MQFHFAYPMHRQPICLKRYKNSPEVGDILKPCNIIERCHHERFQPYLTIINEFIDIFSSSVSKTFRITVGKYLNIVWASFTISLWSWTTFTHRCSSGRSRFTTYFFGGRVPRVLSCPTIIQINTEHIIVALVDIIVVNMVITFKCLNYILTCIYQFYIIVLFCYW